MGLSCFAKHPLRSANKRWYCYGATRNTGNLFICACVYFEDYIRGKELYLECGYLLSRNDLWAQRTWGRNEHVLLRGSVWFTAWYANTWMALGHHSILYENTRSHVFSSCYSRPKKKYQLLKMFNSRSAKNQSNTARAQNIYCRWCASKRDIMYAFNITKIV